jgi:hypothetical protein
MTLSEKKTILECMDILNHQIEFVERTSHYTDEEKNTRIAILKRELNKHYDKLHKMQQEKKDE